MGGETRFLGCLELQRGQVVLMKKERKYSRKINRRNVLKIKNNNGGNYKNEKSIM